MPSLELDQLLRMAIAGILLAEGSFLVWRRPELGMWLLATASLLVSFDVNPRVDVGTTSIYLLDAVAVVLLTVIALTVARGRPVPLVVFGLAVVLGAAILRGMSAYGAQVAINEAREVTYVVVGLVFVIVCVGRDAWPGVERIWRVMAGVLMVAAGIFVVRNGLGTYASTGERALTAAQALVVGQAAVMAMAGGARRHRLLLAMSVLVLVASQQRTVWAATAAAMLVVALRAGSLTSARATRLTRVSVVGAVAIVFLALLVGPSGLRESVDVATSTASASSGTFGWRVEGWRALIDDYAQRSIVDRSIGQPAGYGFGRTIGGSEVVVSPHNMYLTVLLTTGFVGLALFMWVMVRALRRSRAGPVVLNALIWGLLVYFIGYQIGPEQAMVIGAALMATSVVHRTADPSFAGRRGNRGRTGA